MNSKDLLRQNLEVNGKRVLNMLETMREQPLTFPTPNGGCHPLWILGHLAYTESYVVRTVMLGEANPLEEMQEQFGNGSQPVADAAVYPSFDQLKTRCREVRDATLATLESLSEEDLDQPGRKVPERMVRTWTSYRSCLQFTADHWYMHFRQVLDARRASRGEQEAAEQA